MEKQLVKIYYSTSEISYMFSCSNRKIYDIKKENEEEFKGLYVQNKSKNQNGKIFWRAEKLEHIKALFEKYI